MGIALEVGLKRSTETRRAGKLRVPLLSAGDFNNLSAQERCGLEDEDDDEYEDD